VSESGRPAASHGADVWGDAESPEKALSSYGGIMGLPTYDVMLDLSSYVDNLVM
jgi:hypothetical protein